MREITPKITLDGCQEEEGERQKHFHHGGGRLFFLYKSGNVEGLVCEYMQRGPSVEKPKRMPRFDFGLARFHIFLDHRRLDAH